MFLDREDHRAMPREGRRRRARPSPALGMLSLPLSSLPGAWQPHESALRPASPQAGSVHVLFTVMLGVSATVYVLLLAALAYSLVRARRSGVAHDTGSTPPGEVERMRRMRRAVVAATTTTVVILFGFLIADFSLGRASAVPAREAQALRIRVTGQQWWWRVEYLDTAVSRRLTTANEIHVPVGRPVVLELASADVIHSFWMPALNGKKDLIPGDPGAVWFTADTPGVYRGQCAEFCGLEHAKMALVVVAEPRAQFDRWYESQLQPAAPPGDSVRAAGERVFLSAACPLCHTVAGTPANGSVAPDLTHVGSRLTLAAGTLPNSRANLGGWIVDPQAIKPGARMPPNALSGPELQALIRYLEGLR